MVEMSSSPRREREGRRSRGHPRRRGLRKQVKDLLRQSVGKVGLVPAGTQVGETKDRNGIGRCRERSRRFLGGRDPPWMLRPGPPSRPDNPEHQQRPDGNGANPRWRRRPGHHCIEDLPARSTRWRMKANHFGRSRTATPRRASIPRATSSVTSPNRNTAVRVSWPYMTCPCAGSRRNFARL